MLRRAVLVGAVLFACEEPAKAPEPVSTDLVSTPGTDLPPLRIAPCYGESADGGGMEYGPLQKASLPAGDVHTCVDEANMAGEPPFGATTFLVSVGVDARVTSVEVVDSCGVSSHAILCFAQAFRHARIETEQPTHGTLRLTFDDHKSHLRSTASTVGYTTVHDFIIRASEVVDRAHPSLDACARAAAKRGKYVASWAVYSIALEPTGKVNAINIEPFAGDQPILGCAGEALQKLDFPPPPKGAETVRQRLSFEPPP